MVFFLGNHHLAAAMQMSVIERYVLTNEWQTARQMYDTFCKEVTARTKLQPVLANNYKDYLNNLVNEGRAESMSSAQFTKNGAPVRCPAKLYRKIVNKDSVNCSRCGECCKWFVLCEATELTQEKISYIYARGGKISQGFVLIPSVCPHLKQEGDICSCDIYETRPQICVNFKGRRQGPDGIKYYVPEKCTAVRL